ncbi:MAG TPA: SDR family oxidoreductase [Pseudolysinimonas sp.]|nr:SDR family oxidoreductase [Pseudolysinimonas sp.]
MDLGISGRTAVVAASSRGLGRACALALSREGVTVVINSRNGDELAVTAQEIRDLTGGTVIPVVADITTAEGRGVLLGAVPEVDILVTNNAGPKPATITQVTPEIIDGALEGNFLAPFLLMQSVLEGMKERRFGRVVHITSAIVGSPRPHMIASGAARTALSSAAKAVSRELAPFNVTINQLQPERIDSQRQIQMANDAMQRAGITFEEARQLQVDSIPAGRLGRPEEVGDACAFLCAVNSGYISGSNLRLDGGAYQGLL